MHGRCIPRSSVYGLLAPPLPCGRSTPPLPLRLLKVHAIYGMQHLNSPQAEAPSTEEAGHDEASPAALLALLLDEQRLMREQIAALSARLQAPGQLLTIDQVAARWQVSRRTVNKVFDEGKLAATYIEGTQRFSLAAIEATERAGLRLKRRRKQNRSAKTLEEHQKAAPSLPTELPDSHRL